MSDPFASRSVVWEGSVGGKRLRLIVDREQPRPGQSPLVFAESAFTDGLGATSWRAASDDEERAALKAAVFVSRRGGA